MYKYNKKFIRKMNKKYPLDEEQKAEKEAKKNCLEGDNVITVDGKIHYYHSELSLSQIFWAAQDEQYGY